MTLEQIYELVEQHNELERIFGGKFVSIDLLITWGTTKHSGKQSMEYDSMVERLYKVLGKEKCDALLAYDGFSVNAYNMFNYKGTSVTVRIKSVERL